MTKYRGVIKRKKRFQAAIQYQNKTIHIGMFDTPKQAAQAYDKAALEYQGDKAKLNFNGRLITVKEEQIYRLCHPDFFGLTHENAAKLMHMSAQSIYWVMRRIKRKCPALCYGSHAHECSTRSYQSWMDEYIMVKF